MRVVFFGTPAFAIPSIKALINSGHQILAVVTQPDRQSGRGRRVKPGPVKLEAQKAGLKLLQPQKVRDKNFIHELMLLNPSAIVVVAYGQILPPEIIHMPESGCINVHASLLPRYRGAAPISWAIINGEEKTGVTTMLMDEGMDTGPVLLQKEIEIKRDDTAGSLSERLADDGADLLLETMNRLESRQLTPREQHGEASYAPLIKKTDGLIRWSMSAVDVCNFTRGMNPWPGAYSFLEGERIKILKAKLSYTNISHKPDKIEDAGIIVEISGDELIVSAGEGSVSVLELQPSGKAVMSIRAFLQGRDLQRGMKFGNQ